MTNKEIIYKLLQHGALCITEIYEITGWSKSKVRKTLADMVQCGSVNHTGAWRGFYWVENEHN